MSLINPSTPCPACGRSVARWTNGGRIPPHGKRRVRHKCPHNRWCGQGSPRWGTHGNGTNPQTAGGFGCNICHDAREERLAIGRYWKDHAAGFGLHTAFQAASGMQNVDRKRTAICVWTIAVWLNLMVVASRVRDIRSRPRRGGQHAAP